MQLHCLGVDVWLPGRHSYKVKGKFKCHCVKSILERFPVGKIQALAPIGLVFTSLCLKSMKRFVPRLLAKEAQRSDDQILWL